MEHWRFLARITYSCPVYKDHPRPLADPASPKSDKSQKPNLIGWSLHKTPDLVRLCLEFRISQPS